MLEVTDNREIKEKVPNPIYLIKKTLFSLSCLIFIMLFCLISSMPSLAYLVKVNGEVISEEDFKNALSSAHIYAVLRKQKAGKLSEKVIKETLNNMIDHYLLAQEAQRLNLDKDPDYLKALDYYKKELATRAFWQEKFKNIKITDAELRSYYQEKNTKWHFSQIFTRSRKKAEEALKRLKAGEAFSKVAKELSESPYAAKGGDLGFIRKGQMVKEWEQVAFSLKPGEISEIIKTTQGFHIVKLEEIKLPDMKKFERIKNGLKRQLIRQKRRMIKKQWEDLLRARAHIKINQALFKAVKGDFTAEDTAIIAWVNGEPIYLKEFLPLFKRRLWGYNAMRERWHIKVDLDKIKKEVLDGLINQHLVEQEAMKGDYFSKDKEVRRQLDNYKRMLLINTFKQKIIGSRVTVTEEELKRYYQQHQKDYLGPTRYRLRMIRVNSEKKAQEILEELKAGGDFGFLARKNSIADSAKRGGAIGWISEHRLPENIKKVLKKLKPGEISPVIKDGNRYTIILLEEKREGSVLPLEKVKDRIKKQLWRKKFETLLSEYLAKLRRVSNIKLDKRSLNRLEREIGIK